MEEGASFCPTPPSTDWGLPSSNAGLRAAVRSAWAGLGAGFLHTLSGPDHLAVSCAHPPFPVLARLNAARPCALMWATQEGGRIKS